MSCAPSSGSRGRWYQAPIRKNVPTARITKSHNHSRETALSAIRPHDANRGGDTSCRSLMGFDAQRLAIMIVRAGKLGSRRGVALGEMKGGSRYWSSDPG